MRAGDLLAWTHRKWGSWYDFQVQMVRMFTRSEYSHVGIAWPVGGRLFVLEAVSAGVRIFPLSRCVPFYWMPLEMRWTGDMEKRALEQVGAPYSKIRAVMAYFNLIKIGGGKYWECAEYVIHVLQLKRTLATPTAVVAKALDMGGSLNWIGNDGLGIHKPR